jgi:hypothetical protein
MNINSHKIKRYFQKVGIYLIKKINFSGKEKLNYNENEASILFRRIVSDPSTDLVTSPVSGKYYLKSLKNDMLIILSGNQISIINHIYGYNVYISNFLYERLRNVFVEELDKRIFNMEEEFRMNIQHSLKNIIKSLKDEK